MFVPRTDLCSYYISIICKWFLAQVRFGDTVVGSGTGGGTQGVATPPSGTKGRDAGSGGKLRRRNKRQVSFIQFFL